MRFLTLVALVGFLAGCASAPPVSPSDAEAKLAAAEAALRARPDDPDAWIWVGRRLGYLGRFEAAIAHYTRGLERFPTDARFLRHRGHRLLSLRRFAEAEADLERAAVLIEGRPDEIEPDGLPNAANIPTSTLQSNIWYHLGLARYLQGDFEGALTAYRACAKVSTHPDQAVATAYWHFLTLRRLGRLDEATAVLGTISSSYEPIESHSYHQLLRLFKGELSEEEVLREAEAGSELDRATLTYGLAVHHLLYGNTERARELFLAITRGNAGRAFAVLAAEAELSR